MAACAAETSDALHSKVTHLALQEACQAVHSLDALQHAGSACAVLLRTAFAYTVHYQLRCVLTGSATGAGCL